MDVDIGPALDGSISLTQACRICGLTVNGDITGELDPLALSYSDLSGRTTFWQVFLNRVTSETSLKMRSACRETFPEALVMQPGTNSGLVAV